MTTPDARQSSPPGRTAILAGGGRLPEIIAAEMAAANLAPYVIAVSGDTGDWVKLHDHAFVPVTHLSAIQRALQAAKIETVVLVGGIKVRPRLWSFKFDWITLKQLPLLVRSLRKGDDGLLSAAIEWLESCGLKVVGAHQLVPSLLAPLGDLTLLAPDANDHYDIETAIYQTQRLGLADVGQAAVARGGAIIASEDRSGTAAMLARIAAAETRFRRSGVLAKFAKPQQELRVDLPAIGPDTVAQAASAGLAGIVVEAGRALILDREATVAKANDLGIFIVGMRG
jgi:UDP-2,3-diacylglucosamine hydrolase